MSVDIAKVTSLNGKFFTKDTSGNVQELHIGDVVKSGDVVFGANENVSQDAIILTLFDSNQEVLVAGIGEQRFDESLTLNPFEFSDVTTVAENIQALDMESEDDLLAALEEGMVTASVDDNLETAAGEDEDNDGTANGANFYDVNNNEGNVVASLRDKKEHFERNNVKHEKHDRDEPIDEDIKPAQTQTVVAEESEAVEETTDEVVESVSEDVEDIVVNEPEEVVEEPQDEPQQEVNEEVVEVEEEPQEDVEEVVAEAVEIIEDTTTSNTLHVEDKNSDGLITGSEIATLGIGGTFEAGGTIESILITDSSGNSISVDLSLVDIDSVNGTFEIIGLDALRSLSNGDLNIAITTNDAAGNSATSNIIIEMDTTILTSEFIDSAVNNVTFETTSGLGGNTGESGVDGEFSYRLGDMVKLSVGGVVVGEFPAEAIQGEHLFLADIANASLSNVNNEYVENMAIFLQSLDSDGDATNGIQISDETKELFADVDVDLSQVGKMVLSDLLAVAGVEYTADSEFSVDGNNVFETQAMAHVVDGIDSLAGERAPESYDERTADIVDADNVDVGYLLNVDENGVKSVTFSKDDLLLNARGVQVLDENLIVKDVELANPNLGEIIDNGNGTYTVIFNGSETFNQFDELKFNYTIKDWTAEERFEANFIDVIKETQNFTPLTEQSVSTETIVGRINEIDMDNRDDITYSIKDEHGYLSVDDDGVIRLTQAGVDAINSDEGVDMSTLSYTIIASNGLGELELPTQYVDIQRVNDNAPSISAPITFDSIQEDHSFRFTLEELIANASDLDDGDTLHVENLTSEFGVIVDNGDGSYTFTPTEDYVGEANITFDVVDAGGNSTSTQATFEVNANNEITQVEDIDDTLNSIDENVADGTYTGITLEASDADGEEITYSIDGDVPFRVEADGRVVVDGDSAIDFESTQSYTFNVTATSADGTTSTQEVSVNVNNINEASKALDDSATTYEDTSLTIPASDLLANDTDVDGDTLTITDVTATENTHGTVSLDEDGNVVFTPEANYNGEASFTYTISDGNGGTDTATVTLHVESVNDVPTIEVQSTATVDEDGSVTINYSATDVEGDVTVTASSNNGTVTINENGTLTFTPNENFNGNDTITITATDADGAVTTQEVAVTVNAVDDATQTQSDSATIDEDNNATGNVLTNDSDIDSDLEVATFKVNDTTYEAGTTATILGVGAVSIAADGAYTFTPEANYNGEVPTISYTTNTGVTDTLDITVNAVDDVSNVGDVDLGVTAEDTAITFSADDLLANSSDVDGDTLSVTAVSVDAEYGVITENEDGTYTFTPAQDYNGENLPINFTVTDGTTPQDATATLDVSAVNDAITQVIDSDDSANAVNENVVDGTYTGITLQASDVDGDAITYSIDGDVPFRVEADGRVVVDGDNAIDFESAESYTFNVVATSADGTISTQEVSVNVNDIFENVGPQLAHIHGDSAEFQAGEGSVTINQGTYAWVGDENDSANFGGGSVHVSLSNATSSESIGFGYTPSGENSYSAIWSDGVHVYHGNYADGTPRNTLGTFEVEDDGAVKITFADGVSSGMVSSLINSLTYANTNEDAQSETKDITITLTDPHGASTSSVAHVNITADAKPTAVNENVDVDLDSQVTQNGTVDISGGDGHQVTNLVVTLDLSGSMDVARYGGVVTLDDGSTTTRLALAKESLQNLINEFDGVGDVNVNLTTFSTSAASHGWMSATDAIDFINGLQTSGSTNYEDAIHETAINYIDAPQADKTVALFISDGEPTADNNSNGNMLDDAYLQEWAGFVGNNVDQLLVVGMGTGIKDTSYLEKIAVEVGDVQVNMLVIENELELNEVLIETLIEAENIVSGNLLDNVSGGDGEITLDSVEIASVTYSAETFPDGGLKTAEGGVLKIDFESGEYTYAASTKDFDADVLESFTVSASDADGDKVSFDFNINVNVDDSASAPKLSMSISEAREVVHAGVEAPEYAYKEVDVSGTATKYYRSHTSEDFSGDDGDDFVKYAQQQRSGADLDTGAGDDKVYFNEHASGNTSTGAGDDNVYSRQQLKGTLDLGDGDDVFKGGEHVTGDINAGAGDDSLFSRQMFKGNVDAGSGDDTLTSYEHLAGNIDMGSGNDYVKTGQAISGNAKVDGGDGYDTIQFGDGNAKNNWNSIKGHLSNFEHVVFRDGSEYDLDENQNLVASGTNDHLLGSSSTSYEYTISLNAMLGDNDGSESLSDITLTNLPAGATLKDITANADGSYTLTPDENGDVSVTLQSAAKLGEDALNDISASVSATEQKGGDVTTTTTRADGDDTITVDEQSVVDGGAGFDTIVLKEEMAFNFENVAENMKNIEAINLNDTSDGSSIELHVEDVMSMSDDANELIVYGNENDSVSLDTTNEWSKSENVEHEGFNTFHSQNDPTVTLQIENSIHVDEY
jgi:hypothetical protein